MPQPVQPLEPTAQVARQELRQPVLGLPDPGEKVPGLAWPTVALWVGTLALFAVELVGFLALGWSRWVTVPMGAVVTFLMFSVMHEAIHHAVSTRTRLNDLFGHLSTPLVVPWATFPLVKFLHIEHHRNTNEPRTVDPDAWVSEGPSWQRLPRFATIDVYYVAFYLRRVRERSVREVAATAATFAVVWGAFAGLVVAGFGTELLWAFLVPQRIGIVVLAWWFDYLPHHGLTATQREDRFRATRVRVGGERLLTPLFVYQNYHLVHHLHPSVPFYRYVRAWRRNEEAYLDRGAAVSTWFGRSLTAAEYRTWRRLTEQADGGPGTRRPVFHALRVASVEPLTEDSVVVTLDVPADLADRYRWLPGQHVTLRAVVDGREVRRSYSVVDAAPGPDDVVRAVRVAVKRIEGGTFSSYVHRDLAAGDVLDVMTPAGSFHVGLDPARSRELVAVAAGSGITPVLSLVSSALATEPATRVVLFLGNRTRATTMFRDELAALEEQYADRLTVHHVLSREQGVAGPQVHVGRVAPELVQRLVERPADVDAWFLCGPRAMVDDLRTTLVATVDPDRVLTEVFHPLGGDGYGSGGAVVEDVDSEVTVVLDGAETAFALRSTGGSVLDAALGAGVDAPYSCAGGACGTCRARVVLGRAVMEQNHVLADDEVDDGWVLTCQAHPVTEQLRVDYDA